MNGNNNGGGAVAVVPQKTPAELIHLAVEKGGIDLDKLEHLLEIQIKHEANEARKAYHKAMAAFKADPPKIWKDKKVGYPTDKGKVAYSHATLGNVTEAISSALSKHGLSAAWTTKQNGQIFVTCKITHELGHCEETTLSAPADTTGSKNSIQAIGSTITYLQRYTLLALTGLATFDQDDDGAAASGDAIDEKQLHQLRDLMLDKDVKEEKLLAYLKITDLEKLPKTKFQVALTALQSKSSKNGQKASGTAKAASK